MSHLAKLQVAYGPKSRPVTFDELGIPEMPPRTASYVPVGHQDLVSRIRARLEQSQLSVLQESYVLWRNGQRMFGLMQVSHPEIEGQDSAMIVGIRNSFDKSLPAMVTSGDQVFVCDNLIFNGEVVLGRKHTKNIFDDLGDLIGGAMDVLFSHWNQHFARVETYKNVDVGNLQAHDIIAKAFLAGAIGKTQVAEVIDLWHKPDYPEFKDRNLWSLHSAFTQVWRGRLDLLPVNSRLLNRLMDGIADFDPKGVENDLS